MACFITVYPGTLAFSNVLMIASSSLSLNIKSNLFIFYRGESGIMVFTKLIYMGMPRTILNGKVRPSVVEI